MTWETHYLTTAQAWGCIVTVYQLLALLGASWFIVPCQTYVQNMFTVVHHVIITSDSEGPICHVWVNRSMKYHCFFLLGYAWPLKVILKGTLASESHRFSKTNIRNAVERVLTCNWLTTVVYYLLFCNYICVYLCVCMPRATLTVFVFNLCLFLYPSAVSCFIFRVTDRKH